MPPLPALADARRSWLALQLVVLPQPHRGPDVLGRCTALAGLPPKPFGTRSWRDLALAEQGGHVELSQQGMDAELLHAGGGAAHAIGIPLPVRCTEVGVLGLLRLGRWIEEVAGQIGGAVLPQTDASQTAAGQLEAEVASDDPINLFTYAQALLAIEGESHVNEADALFKQALRLAPVGALAEKIKNQQRKLAGRVMRTNARGMQRMDAVEYLSSALEAYRALELEGQKQLLAEVVALSQKGLAINDPNQKHQLRHYKGGSTVSALQAACIYYVGIQLLLPGQDAGIDLAREYALAQGMAGPNPNPGSLEPE